MEPDYRAMLLAVVARSEQLLVQMDAILRDASDTDTVARVSMQLAKQWRLLGDVEQKLKLSRQTTGLKRLRRRRTTRAATSFHQAALVLPEHLPREKQEVSTYRRRTIASCRSWLGATVRAEVSHIGQSGTNQAALCLPDVPPEKTQLPSRRKSMRCFQNSFGKRRTRM